MELSWKFVRLPKGSFSDVKLEEKAKLWGNPTVELLTLSVSRPKFCTFQKSIRVLDDKIVQRFGPETPHEMTSDQAEIRHKSAS